MSILFRLNATFVKSRQILDVLVENEVVEEYKIINEESLVFKIDFHKRMTMLIGIFWTLC